MFKSRSLKNHEQALALIGMVGAVAGAASSAKGRGAERMEAMASVIAALGFDPESIQAVEIDWKSIRVGGNDELVPIMRMVSANGEVKELAQISQRPQESQSTQLSSNGRG